jgi:hypothetical protein
MFLKKAKRLEENGRNVLGPIFLQGPIWFGAETSCLRKD